MNFNKYGRTAQLFDYQTMSEGLVGGILNSDGTIAINAASSSWVITKYIPVAGREFTLQRQASGGATSICLYDNNQTYITGLAYNGNGTVTVSANTDVSYIRFTYYRTENTDNIMLNEGSTPLPYEPYSNTWHDTPHYIHNTSTDTITTPAVIYANDTAATVGLKGNMEQSSTPTPTSPIYPSECGERTKNLFDKDNVVFSGFYPHADTGAVVNTSSRKFLSIIVPCEPNTTYTWSFDKIVADLRNRVAGYSTYPTVGMACTFLDRETDSPSGSTRTVQKFTTTANTHWLILMVTGTGQTAETLTEDVAENAQLEIGTEMTSYEPYGYKIPISSANTTTPVYLGEVETTRQIKKLVLDGTENWTYRSDDPANVFFMYLPTTKTGEVAMSNAYPYYSGTDFVDMNDKEFSIIRSNLAIRNSDYQYESQFKAYLAQQYAAGTPVCVWYVLAEPTTGIVNEPLRKIGDYADTVSGISIPVTAGGDTISVDTTLQPSEVTVNYKGWHPVADVHEADNGAWT